MIISHVHYHARYLMIMVLYYHEQPHMIISHITMKSISQSYHMSIIVYHSHEEPLMLMVIVSHYYEVYVAHLHLNL